MRVSIWQQFSSNHSNSFKMVGEFKEVQSAKYVHDEVRAFLLEVSKWVRDNPQKAEKVEHGRLDTFPPSEHALYNKYAIEPQKSIIDWIWDVQHDKDFVWDNTINHYGNLLIFESIYERANDGKPFDQIIAFWNGHTTIESDWKGDILYFSLDCVAPTEMLATTIYEILLHDLNTRWNIPPWTRFYRGNEWVDADTFQRYCEIFTTWMSFRREHWQLSELRANRKKLKPKKQQRFDYLESLNPANHMDKDSLGRFERAYRLSWYVIKEYLNDEVLRTDRAKRVEIRFASMSSLAEGFPALVEWLRTQDCEVTYEFHLQEWKGRG